MLHIGVFTPVILGAVRGHYESVGTISRLLRDSKYKRIILESTVAGCGVFMRFRSHSVVRHEHAHSTQNTYKLLHAIDVVATNCRWIPFIFLWPAFSPLANIICATVGGPHLPLKGKPLYASFNHRLVRRRRSDLLPSFLIVGFSL